MKFFWKYSKLHCLMERLRRIEKCARTGVEDALAKRFCTAGRRMEACLASLRGEKLSGLARERGAVRIVSFARELLRGGEERLDRERIVRAAQDFDRSHPMEMREIMRLPAALRIAVCEGLVDVAREIEDMLRMRAASQRWVEAGGRLPKRMDAIFVEHALRLCGEEGLREAHRRLTEACSAESMVEEANRRCAACSMRLENLTALCDLLERLDWRRCFGEISVAEAELMEDEVYAAMDEDSKARVRLCVEEIARRLRMRETAVARCALQMGLERGDTACRYLAEDEGREELRRRLGGVRKLRRLVPDPTGRLCVLILGGGAALIFGLCCAAVEAWLLWGCLAPIAWMLATKLAGRAYSYFVKPKGLLKMKLRAVPREGRTLVTLPVLLGSAERAAEMVARMEVLGCLEDDANVDVLLLGDFRDGDREDEAGDGQIVDVARRGVKRLNRNCGREKYFYLHRRRRLRQRDGKWMGAGRKRGALTALNRLLLGEVGGAEAFDAENAGAKRLAAAGYRYVLTLDADTRYLPGTVRRLVGAMLHPLNRKYALLQPCMQPTLSGNVNLYTDLTAGEGGLDGYPVDVSDFYQDMTGWGNFSGKGIYDVAAFERATRGALPEEEILSHDLIEGILCGTGFAGDVCFWDDAPRNLRSELERAHRWTRGDWQLLRVLFSRGKLRAVDRMKLLGNLLRSLFAPALLILLAGAVLLDAPKAFMLGLLAAYLDALLHPADMRAWKRCTLRLAVLPVTAARMGDAILRALWRLFVSRKHLLDWVPAADVKSGGRELRIYGRVAAILLLPGLLRPFWTPGVLGLALLFWLGVDWAEDMAATPVDAREALGDEQRALLCDIARETWRFFERYVPLDGTGLPPDNVQFDPPAGVAARTSPTNIGLYMMSCVAAAELGLLSREEMQLRLSGALSSVERLEKWRGQLYNWYDIDSLEPLRPRYVSAVDSGNLAGALLLCARAADGDTAVRMERLARGMELNALYDGERKLFFIGYDVESGEMSQAHYDLYASEARILSYAAMMLGQVPVEHWRRLGRPLVSVGDGQGLLSWSGTMFEYLMPELLLRSHGRSLAGEGRKNVVAAQMALGRRMNRPWGVSESGYCAFDLHLNYQYRAFGLREMALDRSVGQDVVAPYAAALALCERPDAAARNLRQMRREGWSGAYGMYEAADYRSAGRDGEARVVKSAMAHHQGMILCAIANALRGDVLAKYFMKNPEAQALELLLQEKKGARRRIPARKRTLEESGARPREERLGKRTPAADCRMDAQAMYGGGTTLLTTNRGAAFARRGRLLLNRFSGDLNSRHEGMYVHVEDVVSGEAVVMGQSGRAEFEAGCARFYEEVGGVRCVLTLAVSPEDGAVYQQLSMENPARNGRRLRVTACFAAALAMEGDMRAHATFQNLFVETSYIGGAICFHRRNRERDRRYPEMVYAASMEDVQWETNLERLCGRTGLLGCSGGLKEMGGGTGYVLNPCGALRCEAEVLSGRRAEMHFALLAGENCAQEIKRLREDGAAQRAIQLSAARGRAALRHCMPEDRLGGLAQRAVALLFDANLKNTQGAPEEAMARETLWRAGISGDLPLIAVELADEEGCLREAIALHGYYRLLGVEADLVLIYGGGVDYRQSMRDMAEARIAASHLNELRGMPGGVFLLDGERCDKAALRAILRVAALYLDGGERIEPQLRAAAEEMAAPRGEMWKGMRAVRRERTPRLRCDNGYGGFAGEEYVICMHGGTLPPAPWSNVLAGEDAGAVFTDRGGGFIWRGNSRSGRITPYGNDSLREGWGWMFYLLDEERREWARLLPGDVPMTDISLRYGNNRCRWEGRFGDAEFALEARCMDAGVGFEIEIENCGDRTRAWRLAGMADWLLGVDAPDRRMLRTWSNRGACFASGSCGVGVFAAEDMRGESGCDRATFLNGGDILRPLGFAKLKQGRGGWTLHLPLRLRAGERRKYRFLLGMAGDVSGAQRLLEDFRAGRLGYAGAARALRVSTPDAGLNLMCNVFLPAQVKLARIQGRTGLYQPGGAYGFRDQLQDMLPLIYTDSRRVREHLLRCAARQFEAGDVMHWWHEPMLGVRTGISDDLLFLPYVAARYVAVTQDAGVLQERVPYLLDVAIPEGREDIYAPMQPSENEGTLHEHCMRAFRRANRRGEHGLCLMGSGDWNDGMNRVGNRGRGESVWLTEFMAVCAEEYARVSPVERDGRWLEEVSAELRGAVEEAGWDGAWYLRAYSDDGEILGGKGSQACRIDAISQAWAVLAGLNGERCKSAMNAAWAALADEDAGLIRLLTPPFSAEGLDVGYIAAYPAGIRENGGQYSHAACWLGIAYVRMGDAARAHRALRMLLPLNHAKDKAHADIYRVEPYVMAGDIYTDDMHYGRGGWSWYTGSAAWMLMLVYEILGFARRGNCVRLNTLLGEWQRAGIRLDFGGSVYELESRADAHEVLADGVPVGADALKEGFIEMRDDGRTHRIVFPPRSAGQGQEGRGRKEI